MSSGKLLTSIKSIVAWVIAAGLTLLFVYSAYGKLSNPVQMEQMNLGSWRVIIALGEIVSALLFLIPKTNKIGTLLLSSYMGGAIIIHMTAGLSIVFPTGVLILVWLTGILRNISLIK